LAEILLGKGLDKKKVQGMLQFNGFQPATAAQLEGHPWYREMWRWKRDRVDSKDPVALMDIALACGQHSIAVPVHIHSLAMEAWKQQILAGFNPISVVMGGAATVPFTVETCMECAYVPHCYPYFTHRSNRFMNAHIRADKKNQLLLRTEMRPSDIQVIRDVAANSDSVPAMVLNDKLAREKSYQEMYQELLKRRKAACQEVGR
jgi:hypothetical protein